MIELHQTEHAVALHPEFLGLYSNTLWKAFKKYKCAAGLGRNPFEFKALPIKKGQPEMRPDRVRQVRDLLPALHFARVGRLDLDRFSVQLLSLAKLGREANLIHF